MQYAIVRSVQYGTLLTVCNMDFLRVRLFVLRACVSLACVRLRACVARVRAFAYISFTLMCGIR